MLCSPSYYGHSESCAEERFTRGPSNSEPIRFRVLLASRAGLFVRHCQTDATSTRSTCQFSSIRLCTRARRTEIIGLSERIYHYCASRVAVSASLWIFQNWKHPRGHNHPQDLSRVQGLITMHLHNVLISFLTGMLADNAWFEEVYEHVIRVEFQERGTLHLHIALWALTYPHIDLRGEQFRRGRLSSFIRMLCLWLRAYRCAVWGMFSQLHQWIHCEGLRRYGLPFGSARLGRHVTSMADLLSSSMQTGHMCPGGYGQGRESASNGP